ncbi:hypothetical protein HY78_14590 [Rhizorhabdus wittichii DC-6]|nr:hypothetical protein HY78_14590 [Rhizorhabdus wittichii DC-6]
MKALTIWQPWASLIIAGAKPFEFRGWRVPSSMIGQRIVIHAGARPIKLAEVADLNCRLTGDDAWTTGLHAAEALPILLRAASNAGADLFSGYRFEPLPMSAGIGTAVIGPPISGAIAAETFGHRMNDSDRHDHANWAWPMLDIEPWPEPIAMRGAQGFWNWPTPAKVGL